MSGEERPIPVFDYGSGEFEAFMERIGSRTASKEELDEFCLRIIECFCQSVHAGDAAPGWVLNYLADQLYKILHGGRWEDELPLPWTERSSPFTRAEQKALQIYCDVENARRGDPGRKVTAIIEDVASRRAVSYQTARDGYYKWRRKVSRSEPKESE